MNINALRNFLIIADSENITVAAQKIHIAQPPLSRQLKSLEEDLGVTLFTRSKQRIHLTEEGRYLKEAGKEIIEMIDNTKQQLKDMSQGLNGTLYIGANETSSISILSGVISLFKDKYPNVNYQIFDGNSEEITRALSNNKIDLGIVLEPYNTEIFDGIRIYEGNYIAAMSTGHPLAKNTKDTIKLTELANEPLMLTVRKASQEIIRIAFNDIGVKPNVVCEFALMSTGLSMALNGMGIALLPNTSCDVIKHIPGLTYKTITEPDLPFYVSILRKRSENHSSIDELFWKFISEQTFTKL